MDLTCLNQMALPMAISFPYLPQILTSSVLSIFIAKPNDNDSDENTYCIKASYGPALLCLSSNLRKWRQIKITHSLTF